MIGGKIIGFSRGEESTLVHVQDRNGDRCAVRLVEQQVSDGQKIRIKIGDQVWWQSGKVYWTPYRGRARMPVCRYLDHPGVTEGDDIALPKIGYSHAMSHAPSWEET